MLHLLTHRVFHVLIPNRERRDLGGKTFKLSRKKNINKNGICEYFILNFDACAAEDEEKDNELILSHPSPFPAIKMPIFL